jgi:hypothetical protein
MLLSQLSRYYSFIVWLILVLAIVTRFSGLAWGVPYPMHPDERNMVDAIQRLQPLQLVDIDFYAYGQLPLYMGYAIKTILLAIPLFVVTDFGATQIALRIISALSSVITVWIVGQILLHITNSKKISILGMLLIACSPFGIVFAHYGTTESMLMLFTSLVIFHSLQALNSQFLAKRELMFASLYIALGIATKVSFASFLAVPLLALWFIKEPLTTKILIACNNVLTTTIIALLASPLSVLYLQKFIGSLQYESAVALGQSRVFYTAQFEYTVPVLFHFIRIYPYAFGLLGTILFVVAFFLLTKNTYNNFLRIQFILLAMYVWFMYAKWTRFSAPLFIYMVLFIALFFYQLLQSKYKKLSTIFVGLATILCCLQGLAYVQIYVLPNVRYNASNWLIENITSQSFMLSETANGVDLPISNKPFDAIPYTSFNFYELDSDINLPISLEQNQKAANIVQVPSRRIFYNYTCYDTDGTYNQHKFNLLSGYKQDTCAQLKEHYPKLHSYYENIFKPQNYNTVATFTSNPGFTLFGNELWSFSDEAAEETWSVFDRPTIRVYEKK